MKVGQPKFSLIAYNSFGIKHVLCAPGEGECELFSSLFLTMI